MHDQCPGELHNVAPNSLGRHAPARGGFIHGHHHQRDRRLVEQMGQVGRVAFFDIDMQHCPNCGGGELEIIAAILERPVIEKILTHLGLDPQPPPRGRARKAGQDFAA